MIKTLRRKIVGVEDFILFSLQTELGVSFAGHAMALQNGERWLMVLFDTDATLLERIEELDVGGMTKAMIGA